MFEIAKSKIAKNCNGYIVIIVVMNFCKNLSIAKIFFTEVSWHLHKCFPAQKISVDSIKFPHGKQE